MSATQTRDATYALGGRLTDGVLLKTWGAIITVGWVVSQLVAASGVGSQLALTTFWLVGSLVPITASFLWMRTRTLTGLFPVWTILGVTGLLASFAVIVQAISINETLILGGLWFAGPAVGFLITAFYMNDWSRQFYAGVAVMNLIAAGLVVTIPSFEPFYFVVAAVIQGLPMLYHGTRLD